MKKLGILIIALFSLVTNGLGQLEADYSDCLSELQELLAEWEALETGENISEETKEAIGAQVRDLVESLELGEAAEEHGVNDETIQNGAAQLLSSSIAMSFNALLRGGETLDLAHRLRDAAQRLFGKAETAVLQAEPVRPATSLLELQEAFSALVEGNCFVDVQGVVTNPDSSPQFGRVNLTTVASPPGGTFTWAWFRWLFGPAEPTTVKGSNLFETQQGEPTPTVQVFRDAGLNGEILPMQALTDERGAPVVRQIVKSVSLRGGIPPLGPFDILGWTVAVSYRTPEGARCWDDFTWRVARGKAYLGENPLSDLDVFQEELEELGFPFGE